MNNIGNLIAQALSGQSATEKDRNNHPQTVIKIPGSDNLESGIWSRRTREGKTKYSFSLSRAYTKNGEKKLSRTFNVDPSDGVQVLYSYWFLFERFSNDQGLDLETRKGFADLALRLATAFEFNAGVQTVQPAETQLNGSTLSQQAPNGTGNNMSNMYAGIPNGASS